MQKTFLPPKPVLPCTSPTTWSSAIVYRMEGREEGEEVFVRK